MTLFQEKVWKAAARIKRGRVTTYRDLARVIGFPQAVRAVGNALNKNPFAPKVPCHRVVRSDGSVGGFASGSRKKETMLRKENILIRNHKVHPKHFL